jgi:hypothetical protein
MIERNYIVPCFVKVEDHETLTTLVKWLEKQGYWSTGGGGLYIATGHLYDVNRATVYTTDYLAKRSNMGDNEKRYDCGTNIKLFQVLATITDSDDKDQMFIATKDSPDGCFQKGQWVKSTRKKFGFEEYFRKASIEENIDYFKEPVIKIKKYKEPICELYDSEDSLVGVIESIDSLIDAQIQIAEKQLENYYIVFNGSKIGIKTNGELVYWPEGLYNTTQKLFAELHNVRK